MAHVGSPDTFFNGQAGPYPVRVAVRLPGVIPGLAQISVRVPGANGITRMTVQAIQWNVGIEGAPPADEASRVAGDPELFAAQLWFMAPTSYRVHVTIDGSQGTGTAVVPVLALATAQREMSSGLGWTLSALGLFLAVGLLTLIGAAVRESVVPPGSDVPQSRWRRARIASTVGAVILVLVVLGGRAWWNLEAFAYGESVVYRPFRSNAAVRGDGEAQSGRRVLTLSIDDRRWPPGPRVGPTRYNALMPDHGKLMHMFLIRTPDMDAFAHVHPVPTQPTAEAFDVDLPPLPAGRYRVYGDIVHESGYAQTLTAEVQLGAPSGATAASSRDSDDSWFEGTMARQPAAGVFRSPGAVVTFERGAEPFKAGHERVLKFVVRDAAGAPVALEPYMGMLGHIAVARTEGDVFAHLHPAGSISMAALQKFTKSLAAPAPHHAAGASNEVSTLYAFPRRGQYRLWVQTKLSGQVVTSAFDVDVE